MKLLLNGVFPYGDPFITKSPTGNLPVAGKPKHAGRKLIVTAMKLTVFLLLTMLLKVNAGGFAQKVTLSENKSSLESIFKKITDQTGYVFFYNDDLLKEAKAVTVDLKNVDLKTALDICFRNQPLAYYISNKTIAVQKEITVALSKSNAISFENVTFIPIRGRVIDSKTGDPVVGASVTIKGTEYGTVADKTGEFRLNAQKGNILLISIVGYETIEYKLGDETSPVIRLVQSAQDLKETVVTGVYNRKASSYTGSVLTMSNRDLKRVGNGNFFQSLKNISPSMVLDNFTMGSNPNNMPNLQLRGTSTFPANQSGMTTGLKGNYVKNPNEPLFILDGFEANIERIVDLDINRIERVTILKDAASKALYGSRAANGVIVIETYKLSSNKPLVSYNASVDIELPDLTTYDLTNSLEKIEAERIDGIYNASPTTYDPTGDNARLQQLYNQRRKLALEGLNTYWLAKPLRNGVGQRHALTAELGSGDLKMIGDLLYRNIEGAMKGSFRTTISGNITSSYRVKNLLFRNITSINSNRNAESPYGTFDEYARMNPYWRAENPDGTIPLYAEINPNGADFVNPLYNSTLNVKVQDNYFNFTDNFYLEWTMLPGLKTQVRAGIDEKRSGADEFYPAKHTRFANYSETDANRKGSYQVNNGRSSLYSGDLNVNYSKTVNRGAYFANVGFNVSQRKFSEVIHRAEGFASERMDNIIFARAYQIDSRPSGVDGVNRDIGFLGAFSYTWDERFLSDFTYRTSASSQFGSDKRWAHFWSLGAGWNLHNEAMFKNNRAIEQLKIRGSLGSTGNQNFSTNSSIATYQYYQNALYQGFPGSYVTNLANPNLQWETKFDYNVGVDAKILGLSLRFDYYESYTTNLVTDITVPNSTGFTTVKENLGRVKNNGIEAYASYLVWSKGKNFFTLNASIETNKNRIIELSNAMKGYNDLIDKQAADRGNNRPLNKYESGMSMNAIWAVPSLGIDPATGNEIYLDRSGNTTYIWNANDMVVAGNSLSPYQGTFGFSAEYKNVGLNFTGRYQGGAQLYNQTLVDRVENVDMNYNVDRRVLTGRWLTPGQNALYKRLGTYGITLPSGTIQGGYQEKTRATTRFIQNRNEVTIGALNVYYDFNDLLLQKLSISRLRLGFNMNEVATFSTIKLERGTSYPFARTLSFSLSATF